MTAQFTNQVLDPPSDRTKNAFDMMGRPISFASRQLGYEHCQQMGITDKASAMSCVQEVAEQLQRDKPYEAMAAGMRWLDLTGTYRLFAVLLTAEAQNAKDHT